MLGLDSRVGLYQLAAKVSAPALQTLKGAPVSFSLEVGEDESMKDHVTCPACEVDVVLPDHTLLGEIVKCPNCGVEFEVLSLGPFIPGFLGPENWVGSQPRVPGSSVRGASAGHLV